MKARLARIALLSLVLQLSCNAAFAVTWFDSSVRPDGVGDTNTNNNNATVYAAPAEDGAQVVYGGSTDGEVVEYYDSGD